MADEPTEHYPDELLDAVRKAWASDRRAMAVVDVVAAAEQARILAIVEQLADMQWLSASGEWVGVISKDPTKRGLLGTRWVIDLDELRAAILSGPHPDQETQP